MIRLALLLAVLPAAGLAQSFGTAGQNWTGTYTFPSVSQRSLVLQQAQIMREAELPPAEIPETVYNVINDNRANYVEVATTGEVNTDFQIGDDIGQQTYAVGSLNTGTTEITTEGDNNTIYADNTAENNGCIDASILSASRGAPVDGTDVDAFQVPTALDLADALAAAAAGNCG
ncbi:hypothetical protein [Maritimibacter sp. DP1N21-5]|uniref:hypothetical protein n=1 Tax=Maritimibacter sp. DP1N21-5 TaxID=2836867 RepID=UPI001C481743|nr:hypothetical protein [Maritimibacter sp. DP1N21-5]MBV7410603.1 hypothetical protein [Maritimibacter sp. DP1N21-5]